MTPERTAWLLGVATFLLGTAHLCDWLLLRARPLVASAIWNASLVAILALPLTNMILPRWELSWLPAEPNDFAATRDFSSAQSGEPAPATVATGLAEMDSAPPQFAPEAFSRVSSASQPNAQPRLERHVDQRLQAGAFFWIACFYGAGLAMSLSRLALNWHAVATFRRACVSIDEPTWRSQFASWRQRLLSATVLSRREVALVASQRLDVPAVLGVLRPTIIIPQALIAASCPRATIDAVLVHELAHVARRDCAWQMVERLACALLWFHPLAWLARPRIALARELACDRFAICFLPDVGSYGNALLEIAVPKSRRHQLGLGMAVVRRGHLERRLEALPQAKGRQRCTLPLASWSSLLVSAAVGAIVLSSIDLIRAVADPPIATAKIAAAAQLALTVAVTDTDGQNVSRANASVYRALRLEEQPEESDWRDPTTGHTWRRIESGPASLGLAVKTLLPGTYRVTAHRDPSGMAISGFGMSDPIVLDGSQKETAVSVKLLRGSTLVVRPRIADSGAAVVQPAIWVRRAETPSQVSFPPNWFAAPTRDPSAARREEVVIFDDVPPGEYEITAAKGALVPSDVEYKLAESPVRVQIEPGQNREIELKFRGVRLSDEEIAKHWPWVAEGRVVDGQGRPIAGATVRAATGYGTLLGGGHTITRADGRYTLRFGQGIRSFDGISLQVAIFFASKPGFSEQNLNRQGSFMMALRVPPADDVPGPQSGYRKVILPNQPELIDFVLVPAAQLAVKFLNTKGQALRNASVSLTGKETGPGGSALASGTTSHGGRYDFYDIPVDYEWCLTAPTDNGREVRSQKFKLVRAGQYRIRVQVRHDEATGIDLLEIQSFNDSAGKDVLEELVIDDPLVRPAVTAELQAKGQAILARLAEVNRFWLNSPSAEVKSYQFDFTFGVEKPRACSIDDHNRQDPWMRHGISYNTPLAPLAQQPDNVVFRAVDITPERIQLVYTLRKQIGISAGNGVGGSWRGFFSGPVREGTLTIDPRRMVPLEHQTRFRETFDDYVEVQPGHFAPGSVRIENDRMTFDWIFAVYEPGLWLFASSRDAHHATALPPCKVDNVQVNGLPAVSLRQK